MIPSFDILMTETFAMMGRQKQGQGQFFYEFKLDDVVARDHLVRKIDAVLHFDGIRVKLEPFYSEIARGVLKREVQRSG